MPNSIELAKKFLPVIDEVYKAAAITEGIKAILNVMGELLNEQK